MSINFSTSAHATKSLLTRGASFSGLENTKREKHRTPSTRAGTHPESDAKRSVILIGSFLSSAGLTRGVCEDLADRLEARGWRVFRTSNKTNRVLRVADMMATILRARKEYAVAQVDVFSGRAFLWAEAAAWALRRVRRPYVLALRGGNLPAWSRQHPRRVRALLQRAAAVTTPSRYLHEQMRAYRSDLILLPNAVDIGAYEFRARTAPQPKLMWLRSFHEIYNPTMAVTVTALLADEFPDVRLTMVGPDKGDGSLQKVVATAQQLGVSARLEICGGVPKTEVPVWLNRGDVFLNTTHYESFGVSVMEAAACGLPVIATSVGELPRLWEDGVNALLVPPNDAEAMAEAVRRVLKDPALAEALSCNGRAKAEGFDWSVILPKWEMLLTEVAGR